MISSILRSLMPMWPCGEKVGGNWKNLDDEVSAEDLDVCVLPVHLQVLTSLCAPPPSILCIKNDNHQVIEVAPFCVPESRHLFHGLESVFIPHYSILQLTVMCTKWLDDMIQFICSSPMQNSIRHNLSLHSRFVRIQNEGTGKSSWWMLNPEGGKNGKSPRRRAASMDNNSKFTKSRGRAAKKKVTCLTLLSSCNIKCYS